MLLFSEEKMEKKKKRYVEKELFSVMSKFLSQLMSHAGNGSKLVYFNSL